MKENEINKYITIKTSVKIFILLLASTYTVSVFAYGGGLEGEITQTINNLVRIINILIVGFVVWAGFLVAKGDGQGFTRLIYGVVGLIIANSASLIINYFNI